MRWVLVSALAGAAVVTALAAGWPERSVAASSPVLAAAEKVLVAPAGRKRARKPAASQPGTQPTTQPAARTVTMRGVVFEDRNTDGVRQPDEPGLRDMPVSDGLTIVKTPEGGAFEFQVREKLRGSVFVCTPAGWRASRQFFVITDFDRYAGGTQPADIGLVRDPARNTDRFCFVQLSDTHVTEAADTVATMAEDLAVVGRLSDRPTFLVATGDLTNVGSNVGEMQAYVKATREARYPLYNVVGNHDYGGRLRDTENYERHLGPPYYSFDVGPYHFVAKDVIGQKRGTAFYERQAQWIDDDLRINGVGKRIVVFQHYIPTIPELDWWAERNTRAVFSGHWHGRRERIYKGILDVNSSTFRFGGIDRSPRGFRVIHVEGESMRCEWRLGNQVRRAEILHPPLEGTVRGRTIPIRALAYDSAVRATSARYRITQDREGGSAAVLGEGDLWPEGSWCWAARWSVPEGAAPGPMRIRVDVTAADGDVWTKEGAFTLAAGRAPTARAGDAWPFFHNDAGHRGHLAAGPQPPLSLAWSTHVGGTIHIASPVIAEGRVYAATGFDQTLDDCAVVALDLAGGRILWRTNVDSSVKHSLAAWEGNILAVSQAATLYCLGRDGYPKWTASLDRGRSDRWDISFPVTDGKTVYAGKATGFGAFDLATGASLWRREGGNDWWPSIYSGPSLGTGAVYQGGPFVRALDPASGKILWSNNEMAASTVAVVPAAVTERSDQGDRLYVFHNQKTLRCLDGRTGKPIWEGRFDKPDGTGSDIVPLGDETGTPAVGDDIVCVGGAEVKLGEERNAAMHGFDKATGRMRWRFPIRADLAPMLPYKRSSPTITSSPVIVGETVYFGASDGWFYALNARDGRMVWRFWFGLPVASTPAVSGNTVIVATWDGTIHALTAE